MPQQQGGRSSFERNVDTRYDIPESFGEMYREPGIGETYDAYTESKNFWRIVGFGKEITDSVSVHQEEILNYRSLIMKYCSSSSDIVLY